MKLIIVRHGETKANVEHITQGVIGGKLTKKGISQANKLGKRLAKENIDFIYCSDLGRTKETAQKILKQVHAPIRYIKDIRERNLGIFEGTKYGSVQRYIKYHDLDMFTFRPKNGESRKDVSERVLNFFKKCLKKHPDKTVLWVTHGGIMMRVHVHFLNASNSHYDRIHPSNCAVSIMEASKDGSHKVHLINCTKHLQKKSRKKLGAKRKTTKIIGILPIIWQGII